MTTDDVVSAKVAGLLAWDTYRIEQRGSQSVIICLVCGAVSYHPMDVKQLYCARCSVFHGDRVETFRHQFLLGVEPMPEGVAVVWVDSYQPERVLCVHPEQPEQLANMDFAVKTPVGWRVVRHGDLVVTLVSGERVLNRGGVWLGLERSPTAG